MTYTLNTNSSDFFQIDGSTPITTSSTNVTGGTAKGMGSDSISGLVDSAAHGQFDQEKYGSQLAPNAEIANLVTWAIGSQTIDGMQVHNGKLEVTTTGSHGMNVGNQLYMFGTHNPSYVGYTTITVLHGSDEFDTTRDAVGSVSNFDNYYRVSPPTHVVQQKGNYAIKRVISNVKGTQDTKLASGASDFGYNKIHKRNSEYITKTALDIQAGMPTFNSFTNDFRTDRPILTISTNSPYTSFATDYTTDDSSTNRGVTGRMTINTGGRKPEKHIQEAKTG